MKRPQAKVRRWLERTTDAHPLVSRLEIYRDNDDAPVESLDVPAGQARDWVWELSDDVSDLAEHYGEGKLVVRAVDPQGATLAQTNVFAAGGAMVHAGDEDDGRSPHESFAKIVATTMQQNQKMAEICLKSAQSANENHRELVELVHELVLGTVKSQVNTQRDIERMTSERQERDLELSQFNRSQLRKDKALAVFTDRLGPEILDRLGMSGGDSKLPEFMAELRMMFEGLSPETQGSMLSELPEEQAEKLKAMLGVS